MEEDLVIFDQIQSIKTKNFELGIQMSPSNKYLPKIVKKVPLGGGNRNHKRYQSVDKIQT